MIGGNACTYACAVPDTRAQFQKVFFREGGGGVVQGIPTFAKTEIDK